MKPEVSLRSSSNIYTAASLCLLALLLFLEIPSLWFSILRMLLIHPINLAYNEGWNVIHTTRLLNGEALYVSLNGFPLTPVNYPPISFIAIGALSYFTGSVLLTGRVVALLSLFLVGYFIYKTIADATRQTVPGLLGALLWLLLMTQLALVYVGYYDPQLFAHVFSSAAFLLYLQRRDKLTPKAIYAIALLCCIALFTKHLLIAVPLSIAICLIQRSRKDFMRFAFAGFLMASLMLLATYGYAGDAFFSNFLDNARRVYPGARGEVMKRLLVDQAGAVLFLPVIVLCLKDWSRVSPVLVYFLVSLLVGFYASGGVGVDINAWFDFFIAVSLAYGFFAARYPDLDIQFRAKPLAFVILLAGILVNEFVVAQYASADGMLKDRTILSVRLGQSVLVIAGLALLIKKENAAGFAKALVFCGILASILVLPLNNLSETLDVSSRYVRNRQLEDVYRHDVEALRAIPGPALFENSLLGFQAGKEFLFDPFAASQLIVDGRIKEQSLVSRIREKDFGAIVLARDLDKTIGKLNGVAVDPSHPKTTASDRWTDLTLLTIRDNYQRLDFDQPSRFFFYIPRRP